MLAATNPSTRPMISDVQLMLGTVLPPSEDELETASLEAADEKPWDHNSDHNEPDEKGQVVRETHTGKGRGGSCNAPSPTRPLLILCGLVSVAVQDGGTHKMERWVRKPASGVSVVEEPHLRHHPYGRAPACAGAWR